MAPVNAPAPVSTSRLAPRASRLVFFGMRCAFSAPALAALLEAGFDVRAVVLPGASAGPAVQVVRPTPGTADEVERLAAVAGVPVLEVSGLRQAEVVAALAGTRPDLLVVACFPWRLPPAVRSLAPRGGLNVHPSLLPAGRGPEPVFWTLRRGERWTGATVHRLDDRLDAGPIVAQERVPVPEGVRAPDLERELAELGGRLLVSAARSVLAGETPGAPQDDARASQAPVPGPADWIVPTNLPAGWAYNFVRGVAPLGGPLTLLVLSTGERFALVDAVGFESHGELAVPHAAGGAPDELLVRFRPGTARFRLAVASATPASPA
jgi:methionyl-tRNA formyltransferase